MHLNFGRRPDSCRSVGREGGVKKASVSLSNQKKNVLPNRALELIVASEKDWLHWLAGQ